MLPSVNHSTTTGTLGVLETYYDAAPRPAATTEEIGPFTLFVRTDPGGWPFYARPRLGLDAEITADDVRRTRQRQRELGVPEAIEWVDQTTPSLLGAARAAGLDVAENPLLVLDEPGGARSGARSGDRGGDSGGDPAHRVRVLGPDDELLLVVVGAIGAGFRGTDAVEAGDPGTRPDLIRAGLLSMVAAFDESGEVVGGGSHGVRGATTEVTGIAVLPRARRRGLGAAITRALVADARGRGVETVFLSAQDDAVARVYEQVGFVRVGTACVASPR
jgi:ribosomal protein S18 acetylase RimI-like enzyme